MVIISVMTIIIFKLKELSTIKEKIINMRVIYIQKINKSINKFYRKILILKILIKKSICRMNYYKKIMRK
jgi:hypothetical protein